MHHTYVSLGYEVIQPAPRLHLRVFYDEHVEQVAAVYLLCRKCSALVMCATDYYLICKIDDYVTRSVYKTAIFLEYYATFKI